MLHMCLLLAQGANASMFCNCAVVSLLPVVCRPAGNAFCFPRYRAAVVEKPMFACADSYTLNHTKLGFACVKRSFSKMNNCFKTMECPDAGGYTQMNEIWWVD